MRQRYRDVLDPNDPYWPRVRRLHIYLWANGTLAAKNRYVVMASFLDLLISSSLTLFSWAWRGALLFVALFLMDWIAPGIVSCVFRETIGYDVALFALSRCTVFDVPYLSLISLAALFVIVLILIYPPRGFLNAIFLAVFHSLNIVALGYPLKFVAYLASVDPTLTAKWFDKSHVFGPITVGMVGVLPHEYKHNDDHLWDVYGRSQSPAHEQELEDLLEELEARYFG